MTSKIDGKAVKPIPANVQAKVRAGVPLHKAMAGAVSGATGPRVKVD